MDPAKKMRVLVVDGLPLARFALSSLLDLHPLVTVCGEARDVPDARQQCEELKPHFVVTDLNLPRGDGVELIHEFRTLHPPAQVLVVSEEENTELVHRAFRSGARAYLSKHDEAAELLVGIEAVMGGTYYASRRVAHVLLESVIDGNDGRNVETGVLSNRELHVFRLLGKKLGATAIASELGLSVKTIETHQMRIKQKLSLRTSGDVRARAAQWIAAMNHRAPSESPAGLAIPGHALPRSIKD